jgi:hypothetical protein
VSEDGKVVARFKGSVLPRVRAATSAGDAGQILDPGTREALEKLIGGLKAEVRRLADEGNKEESANRLQSIRALEQLLDPGPGWAVTTRRARSWGAVPNRMVYIDGNSRAGQEMKKLHARLAELRDQASKNAEGEAHAKIQQEIAELHNRLAERKRQLIAASQSGKAFTPGPTGAPPFPKQPVDPATGDFVAHPGGGFRKFSMGWPWGPAGNDVPEAAALDRKALALFQAAAQLKQAGLEGQGRSLNDQAEKLQAEAERLRARARGAFGVIAGTGTADGNPAIALQQSIQELKEQIQQLRKEIAELREVVQQTQK